METWRDIPGYGGAYQVSDLGRVRSLDREVRYGDVSYRRRGVVLSQCARSRSSAHRSTRVAGKNYQVHRLVLAAFVGPCPPGHEVRHLDGDPTNNTLRNLRYGTREQNAADRIEHRVFKLSPSEVLDIRNLQLLGAPINKSALARRYGVSRTLIRDILNFKAYKYV